MIDLKEIERKIFVDEYGEDAAKCQEEVERLESELADARQRLMWSKMLGKFTKGK